MINYSNPRIHRTSLRELPKSESLYRLENKKSERFVYEYGK